MFPITLIVASTRRNMPEPELDENNKLNSIGRVLLAGIVGDALLAITALVVGILGVVGVIHGMPPALGYSLLGVSGFIVLGWGGITALSKGSIYQLVKNILNASLPSAKGPLNLVPPLVTGS